MWNGPRTTQRYMHLSPAAIEGAIRLLETQGPVNAEPHEEHHVETFWRQRMHDPLSPTCCLIEVRLRATRYVETDFAGVTGLACLDEARAQRERSLAGSTGLEPAASGVT